MKDLDSLMGSGDSDISRIAESVYARLDKASTAVEMRASNLDAQIDDILDRNTLDAQLAERRKKLGLSE
jgi:phage shock protein A